MMVAILALVANRSTSRPARLVLVQAPISANSSAIVPAPVIEVQDASGRRVRDADVEVRVDAGGDHSYLVGTTSVRPVQGLATFNDIAVSPDAPQDLALRFSAEGMQPVTTRLAGIEGPTLWLDRARLNGQELTPASRVVTIAPGEDIRGEVVLRYSAYWAAASVILGAFPGWGDKRENFVTISALATPVVDAMSRHLLSIPGPDRPGDYHLVLAFAAETDARWIASGTNWAVGTPIWGDGNDLADLPDSALDQANRLGHLRLDWYFRQIQGYDQVIVATTTIEVRAK